MIKQSRENFLKIRGVRRVILYGAGEFTVRFLSYWDVDLQVAYICDNDERKWQHKICGIDIVSPERLYSENPDDVVVVVTTGTPKSIVSIFDELKRKGRDLKVFNAYILLHDVFENVASNLYDNYDKIKQVEDLLYDDVSKHIYREVVRRRMEYGECDFSDLIVPGDVEYRIPLMFEQENPHNEVIIDCGAFVGDTLKGFYNTFGTKLSKFYAFECGEMQLQKLRQLASRMQKRKYCPEIIIMPYGVSDKAEKVSFFAYDSPGGSFIGDNRQMAQDLLYDSESFTVETVKLDETIPVGQNITLIKMDIEGSEYRALQGARNIITKYKPRLAISVYHSGEDYYRLPLLIKEMVPDYKIAIRHHKKSHVDTDMYCFL